MAVRPNRIGSHPIITASDGSAGSNEIKVASDSGSQAQAGLIQPGVHTNLRVTTAGIQLWNRGGVYISWGGGTGTTLATNTCSRVCGMVIPSPPDIDSYISEIHFAQSIGQSANTGKNQLSPFLLIGYLKHDQSFSPSAGAANAEFDLRQVIVQDLIYLANQYTTIIEDFQLNNDKCRLFIGMGLHNSHGGSVARAQLRGALQFRRWTEDIEHHDPTQ